MPFCFLSSPSQTLRLTPLTRALRAARAHDAILRMYPDLPLRFIKIHGDILVSYAYKVTSLPRLVTPAKVPDMASQLYGMFVTPLGFVSAETKFLTVGSRRNGHPQI